MLAGYIRRKRMTIGTAVEIAEKAETFLGHREYTVPTVKILELVNSSTCSAYDCEFVALAEDLQVPLATSDVRIVKCFPKTAKFVGDFPVA